VIFRPSIIGSAAVLGAAGAAGGKLRERHHRKELAEQLETAIAITRLTTGFPTVPPVSVRHIVNASWNEFPGAPVRDFVPVLVERNSREQLRRIAADQSPR
jgi:hypothetical protein